MVEISVIVPCYNSSTYIENCLGMLQTQTFSNFEVICVNDGSTDNTLELCRNFAGNDNRFKIINQENRGLGGARNTGINLSNGKYITFVDSDDWIVPDYLKILWERAEDQGLDIVDAFHTILLPAGKVRTTRDWAHNNNEKHWLYIFAGHAPSNSCCRFFKKSLIVDNNLFFPENRIHEDLVFTYRAYYHAKSTTTVEKPLYIWNMRSGSLSRSFTIRHLYDLLSNIRSDYEFAVNNFEENMEYFSLRKLFIIDKIVTRIKYLAAENDRDELVSHFQKFLKNEPLFSMSKFDLDKAIALTGKYSINRISSIKKNAASGVMDIFYDSGTIFTDPRFKRIDDTVTQIKNAQLNNVTFTFIVLEILRRIGFIKYKASRCTTIWFAIGKLFLKIRKGGN